MIGNSRLIHLDGVSRRYELGGTTVTALDRVDLAVSDGEFVVVLGPSGSGKTTLINLIGALDTATEGTISIAGVDISDAKRKQLLDFRRRSVSFIFQSFNIFPGLTARENVQFGIDAAGRDDAPDADDVLEQVAIARALATGNPILLADEPTGELDFTTGVQILELLREQAGPGTAVLAVTHNREISRIADRVIELSSGRIASDGPPPGGRAELADLHW